MPPPGQHCGAHHVRGYCGAMGDNDVMGNVLVGEYHQPVHMPAYEDHGLGPPFGSKLLKLARRRVDSCNFSRRFALFWSWK